MHVVATPGSARAISRTCARPLGFVPTMGALHAGHLALVARARAENAGVAASIFVNPLQFGPHEDFTRYPRALDRDLELLEAAGVDFVYAPSPETMYPPGFATAIAVEPLGSRLEGERRPGHFAGVATVVVKLLHAVEPSALYLGRKDAQQAALLRTVVRDLDLPVEVRVIPTVREDDGLALSSRNAYLSPGARRAAPSLHRALESAARALERDANAPGALAAAREMLEAPLEWDYLEVVDPDSFERRESAGRGTLVVGAVRAGSTRLLDNVPVGPDS